MRHVVRRVNPLSALIYGLLLGLCGWLIPGALAGWLSRATVLWLRDWIGGLQIVIPLPLGNEVILGLPELLSLGDTQARLVALGNQGTALALAVALGTVAAGMLLTGLTALLAAIVYNLLAGVFGGMEVTLDALEAPLPVTQAERAASAPRTPPRPASPAPAPVVPSRRESPKATPPAPAAWLSSAAGGERHVLRKTVTRIGSAPENDIVIAGLAPQHAEIRREGGRFLLYDLGSRRTWVNDIQVAAVHMLKDGFRLQMGQAEFTVHILTSSPTTPEEG